MKETNSLVGAFRKAGLKITPQRLSIFQILQGNRRHPSAEEVYREVLKEHPSVSFTTVYKTLQVLRDMGQIQELTVDGERSRFDPRTDLHSHAFCLLCRTLLDLPAPDHGALAPPGELEDQGFQVRGVQLHFTGLCRSCSDSGS